MFLFRQIRFASLGWRGVVGIALAAAVLVALIVLSLGLAIILLPVVALALLIGRWRLARLRTEMTGPETRGEAPAAGRIIDGEYSVIEDGRAR